MSLGSVNGLGGGSGSGAAADDVTYDNSTSGLNATDVQAAITELALAGHIIDTIPSQAGTLPYSGSAQSPSWNNYNCMTLDIRHFYQSLKPEVVMDRMRQLVKDRRILDLIWRVVKDGILIGAYTSQWFANTTLQPLDHMIREGGYGVSHYISHTDLTGYHSVRQEYPDQTVTDNFRVVRKLRSAEDVEGNCYDWYEIDHHYRITDKTGPLATAEAQNRADIDFIAMETGVEL